MRLLQGGTRSGLTLFIMDGQTIPILEVDLVPPGRATIQGHYRDRCKMGFNPWYR